MLKILDLSQASAESLADLLPRPKIRDNQPTEAVREILATVKREGDAALFEYTERFDGVVLDQLEVPPFELEAAYNRLPPTLREALEVAAHAVLEYHRLEAENMATMATMNLNGMEVSERSIPVDRAGCYVPGGMARYPSSVIMTAGIARAAGVKQVVLCVPPDVLGKIDDATLAAAHICRVDHLIAVGGAQAIAAMAFGTESVPKVDVICGPGNIYVSVAKREVASVVGVPSSFAGPSEVVVMADSSVPARWAALDIAVQAEHGPDGLAWLVTWDSKYANEVVSELESYLISAPRASHIISTLNEGGYAVVARDREQAHVISNLIAPEHLELLYRDADMDLDLVRCAGAVFVGPLGGAAFGDYVAGPSHVLPTFGSARYASALGVADFRKRIHFVSVERSALEAVGWAVEAIADSEGLLAHKESIAVRRKAQEA